VNETPILDRLQPLPAAVSPRPGMTVVIVVWVGTLLILCAGVLLGRPPVLREWLFHSVPEWIERRGIINAIGVLLGSVIVVSFVMVAVHEGGHVIGGVTAGFRFKSIRVGPFHFDRASGLSFSPALSHVFSGVAVVTPVAVDKLVPRGIALVAGGPAVNILSGCVALLAPVSIPSALFVVQSIGNGLSDLLPYRNSLGVSDGAFLWALLRYPAVAERWLALMKLNADTMDGTLPEALPVEFLNKAVAVRDDSIDTVAAHAFAFSNAFHQHKDVEAGRFLEICLSRSNHAPGALRQALMSEAAVFQARRRRRVDLAEQWLADIPESTELGWLRLRSEAAILEAKSNLDEARARLEECEAAVATSPGALLREYRLRLLRRWKSELNDQPRVT
jgi:hypothetical protein